MISSEGERVDFSESVFAEGNVEFWLSNIEKMMVKSLYDLTKKAWQEYPEDGRKRNHWLFDYPAQPVLTIDQVMWTNGCQSAISEIEKGKNKRALEEFRDFSNEQINAMVGLVRGELTGMQRTEMGALIVLDVHALTVVQNMIAINVNNMNNFEWTRQLRYYWEEDVDDCVAR